MFKRFGRSEKRIPTVVPAQLMRLADPGNPEHVSTENVSAHGVRLLSSHSLQPQELLLILSVDGQVQTQAKVVYCERLADGHFAVGLSFQPESPYSVQPFKREGPGG